MSMETGFGSGSAEAVEDQASVPMETAEPVISKARRCFNRVFGFDGMLQPVSGVDINGATCNTQCRHNCCSAERGVEVLTRDSLLRTERYGISLIKGPAIQSGGWHP
jgi:hypothetical protein